MNLTDEVLKKQVLKFQINDINKDFQETFYFIEETLLNNSEGTFNLNSNIKAHSARALTGYLERNNKNYEFELNYSLINSEIMFKKKGDSN